MFRWEDIRFDGCHFRHDIAHRALNPRFNHEPLLIQGPIDEPTAFTCPGPSPDVLEVIDSSSSSDRCSRNADGKLLCARSPPFDAGAVRRVCTIKGR